MRTLLRYLLVSGIAVGLAWGLFVVRFGDRTLFGHARAALDGRVGDAWARLKSGLDERLDELNGATQDERKKKALSRAKARAVAEPRKLAAAKPSVKSAKPAPSRAPAPEAAKPSTPEEKRSEARVDKLKQAESLARAMQRADAAPPAKSTKIDERISTDGRAKVDALLSD